MPVSDEPEDVDAVVWDTAPSTHETPVNYTHTHTYTNVHKNTALNLLSQHCSGFFHLKDYSDIPSLSFFFNLFRLLSMEATSDFRDM